MKNIDIKKDRLRYTKNTLSSTLAIVAIVFNVLYFVSIYNSDVGNYYYSINIGYSILSNLLFLLFTFLSSEGVKNYKYEYSYLLFVLGGFQILRIFGIPMDAHSTYLRIDGKDVLVMDDNQFIWTLVCLIISAICCFAAAIIGIIKTKTLRDYEKSLK